MRQGIWLLLAVCILASRLVSCGFGTEKEPDLADVDEPCLTDADCWSDLRCARDICVPKDEECHPDYVCLGFECGADPLCGNSCGTCPDNGVCLDGICNACEPMCDGVTCGDDGCGGQCGTCLETQGCHLGQCVTLPSESLYWQANPMADLMSFEMAEAHCANLTLDGFFDWRLPTLGELRSLVVDCEASAWNGPCNLEEGVCLDPECRNESCVMCPSVDTASGKCYWAPGTVGTCAEYWSSSAVQNQPGSVWALAFDIAYIDIANVNTALLVRCVHSK